MAAKDIDKWMLDIEKLKNPTPRQRRQHLKLEYVRDNMYEKYIKQFEVDKRRGRLINNECPEPKICSARAFRKRVVQAIDKMLEVY